MSTEECRALLLAVVGPTFLCSDGTSGHKGYAATGSEPVVLDEPGLIGLR
jgi:hypothetical protein